MTTEETPSALLTLVMAFVRRKYKIYIFYGVIICDKHYSIVNLKKKKMVLATDMKPLKMVKYFGGKIPSFLFTFVKTFSHRN